jgi:amino acid transporter
MGALFLAGWSAYGAEIALTYGPEHRAGPRAAVRSLLATGGVMVLVYSLVPVLLVSAVGIDRVADDPANALGLVTGGGSIATTALLAIGIVALLLGLDTVAAADSRVLFQMARNGDAWAFLGRLNRRGAPANALAFDGIWNAALLAAAVVLTDGNAAAVPVVLLTAASVGYFTSLVLALWTAWTSRRDDPDAALAFRAPRGLMALAPVVAVFDALLIVGAGAAWGWRNVGLGIALLAVLMLVRPASVRTAALARAAATR